MLKITVTLSVPNGLPPAVVVIVIVCVPVLVQEDGPLGHWVGGVQVAAGIEPDALTFEITPPEAVKLVESVPLAPTTKPWIVYVWGTPKTGMMLIVPPEGVKGCPFVSTSSVMYTPGASCVTLINTGVALPDTGIDLPN